MLDGRKTRGIQVSGTLQVNALLYADDLVLICESMEILTECTKWMTANGDAEDARLEIDGDPLERVDKFVYLGSMVSSKSISAKEMRRSITTSGPQESGPDKRKALPECTVGTAREHSAEVQVTLGWTRKKVWRQPMGKERTVWRDAISSLTSTSKK
ncbi:hypothetical protein BpHYR1_052494 [Brachionus plicatilis]|uniref:Reverse transcriptase domain-containing protein n=1 Tax=Brachionus plicatilis TaxID=10195 RepID=A0A3M7R891_BRAPC|nr:hypothetical protein BpHYR1_052494 [Brachionus plicatilis]